MAFIEALADRWRSERVETNGEGTVLDWEKVALSVGLFRQSGLDQYYRTLNGMHAGRVDQMLLHFLSLESSVQIFNEWSSAKKQFVLVDYLIYSHYFYVLTGSRDTSVYVTDGGASRAFACSFEEFVKKYLVDSASMATADVLYA